MENTLRLIIRDRVLLLLLLPGLIYFIVFKFAPMYGVIVAFQDYSIFKGFFDSKWVGLKHFIIFFQGPDAWKLIRNTLLINVYQLAFAFPWRIVHSEVGLYF